VDVATGGSQIRMAQKTSFLYSNRNLVAARGSAVPNLWMSKDLRKKGDTVGEGQGRLEFLGLHEIPIFLTNAKRENLPSTLAIQSKNEGNQETILSIFCSNTGENNTTK